MRRHILYALLFIANFIISAYLTMSFLLKTQDYVKIPDFKGKTFHEARRIAKDLGLNIVISKTEKSEDVPKGHIVRQRPEAGSTVKKGRKVYVNLSSGPEMVVIPDLRGLTLDVAKEILKEKGLEVKRVLYVRSEKEGKVLAQSPKENEPTLKTEKVSLVVGKREKVFYVVPDMGNLDLEEVLGELEEKGIRYRIQHVREFSGERRVRVECNVAPGSIISTDDEIEIIVNLGG